MKNIKVMHFVSGLGNDGVTQVIKNYTSRLNQHYNIDNIIVYQHQATRVKIKELQEIGDRLYEIPYKSDHPIANLRETYRIIKNEKPDIVHAHMSLLCFYPLSIAYLLGVKVRIAHAHIAQDNVNLHLATLFKKLNFIFANRYIACGEAAGKYMFANKNYDILYNAIDQEKFKFNMKNRKQIRRDLGISEDTILLGNIGRLTEQKNQIFLIKMFKSFQKKHNDSQLILIGEGELREKLELEKKKLCLQKKIRIINGTNHPEYYYSACDFFLLPSLYEGLPVSAIEAQASGVNTILSDSIDKSVNYNNASFVSIQHGVQPWINEINKNIKDKKRDCNFENIYNINTQYKKLYKLYINYLKN
ncbi:glycosyltransferase family 1 protein [Lactobacillus reuteri]|uniref:glycosyltransferase n=2 Tax=Limosilactobacillus reuteri TaxID=1598 RepID=UPI00146B5062|nr:glycosyltransferase [Limosilactobacillus reuteri]NMV52395.1 glycosyltransferase family 1 protein [Limosilactobacillus reuteri]NMV65232.1 glycosyltransferase family 1 protein [Limosilactobacillus reuteri]